MGSSESSRAGSAGAQHGLIGIDQVTSNHVRTTHPKAAWFPDAGLGLFLHWGLSSVDGNMDLSWGMMAHTPYDGDRFNTNKMRPVDYWGLADRFDPSHYDPVSWLEPARDAGVTYAVLTTKHHEGFALWPSEWGEFSTRTHLGGRDLLLPYVEACRKLGIKVGFYYSPPDWYLCRDHMSFNYRSGEWPAEWIERYPEAYALVPRGAWDETWNPRPEPEPMPEAFEAEFARYVRGQVTELLSNYGEIDLIWFDGNPFTRFVPITVEEIRDMQPGIVINPRLHGVVDFETPECRMPESRPAGWWEGCFIWNIGGWGYTANETYQSTQWFLDLLVRHRSWDGNLLINCAPRPDGSMPDAYYLRMRETARWMERHHDTVFGTRGGPWPEACDVPVTIGADGSWFLHLTDRKSCTVVSKQPPSEAVVHASGRPVPFLSVGEKTIIVLRYEDVTGLDDVVRLTF